MRNLTLRTATGVLFVAVMMGCIWYSPVTFAALFTIIAGLTTWEFCTVVNRHCGVQVNRPVCTLASTYLFVASWCSALSLEPLLLVPYLLVLIYLLVAELYRGSDTPTGNWAYSFMSQMYIAVPFALLNVVEFWDIAEPGLFVLTLFVLLWCSDTGAYCTGSLIGRHKLFPSVSPGKTWEGSIGGGVLAVAVSALICWYVNVTPVPKDYLMWCGLALTVVVSGTWGDLIESLLKRRLGIKDSGRALPGHGGWLDRFDSSLLAIPAVVIYLLCWL